jgi:hypothetical protein
LTSLSSSSSLFFLSLILLYFVHGSSISFCGICSV